MKKYKAKELPKNSTTYLIYGNPGLGKTYSLGFLPGKTLVLDIDQGSSTLSKHPNADNIEVWRLDSSNMWNEWLEVTTELVGKKEKYEKEFDNICVDNLTELFKAQLENLGKEAGTKRGVPSQANYQESDFMNLRSLRGLNSMNLRIVLTAWETTDQFVNQNGQSFTRAMPDIREKIVNNYLGLCDVVGRLVVSQDKEGNTKRGFILEPTNELFAKNRLEDNRKGCKVEELVIKED